MPQIFTIQLHTVSRVASQHCNHRLLWRHFTRCIKLTRALAFRNQSKGCALLRRQIVAWESDQRLTDISKTIHTQILHRHASEQRVNWQTQVCQLPLNQYKCAGWALSRRCETYQLLPVLHYPHLAYITVGDTRTPLMSVHRFFSNTSLTCDLCWFPKTSRFSKVVTLSVCVCVCVVIKVSS